MKVRININLVFITGLVMGILAAAVQAFFEVRPPEANGICLIGHPRDFVNLTTNNIFGTGWPINESFIVFPALTVFGVLIGSFISAYRGNELRLQSGPVRKRFAAVMFGFMVANFGLLWGACPIRTVLLASYGNLIAVMVLASIAVGVLLAVIFIKFRTRKETFR